MQNSCRGLISLWRLRGVGFRGFDDVFNVTAVTKSKGQNRFFAVGYRECLDCADLLRHRGGSDGIGIEKP